MKFIKNYSLLAIAVLAVTSCKKTEVLTGPKGMQEALQGKKNLFASGCVAYKGTVQLNGNKATGIQFDKAGNVYIAAYGPENSITKYNAAGVLQWTKKIGGVEPIINMGIADDGKIYAVFKTIDYMRPDYPHLFNSTYCAVLNSEGAIVRHDEIAIVLNRKGNTYVDMKVDNAGNQFMIGNYDAGYSIGTHGQPDTDLPGSGFIFQKWSPSGSRPINKLFLKTALKGLEKLNSLHLTADGGFIIIGQSLISNKGGIVVAKFNSNAEQVWFKLIPDGFTTSSYRKMMTEKGAMGDIYVHIKLFSTSYHEVLLKIDDATGSVVWRKELPAEEQYIERNDMAIDRNGNVYFTGTYTGNPDFDNGNGGFRLKDMTLSSQPQIFMDKYSVAGAFVAAGGIYNISSILNAQAGEAINVDENGNIYHAGFFTSETDFDPTNGVKKVTPDYPVNVFVNKLSQCK
ncbi:hypothetical protein DJ568_08525 [Mucilaginibacter hurinus]|uniref:Bulb-type lectin domain-containing protein n=1 Tax=Mucilaginibacter hurinus TaxID=2201324 RepID=A0A367GP05_9SPHI|nr:hypothetical protein [Mucilaginibacter hurinus]RCH55222.1 hypothetical protein DJ568_08525 [Mucilaginibacter hurinus]